MNPRRNILFSDVSAPLEVQIFEREVDAQTRLKLLRRVAKFTAVLERPVFFERVVNFSGSLDLAQSSPGALVATFHLDSFECERATET